MIMPLTYHKDYIKLVDQRKLPLTVSYVICRTERDVFDAIVKMKIRGAPAIGIAGAFGLYLGICRFKGENKKAFLDCVFRAKDYLVKARPTAVNLRWALEKMVSTIQPLSYYSVSTIKNIAYQEAVSILKDDWHRCEQMGSFGAQLIKNGEACLTVCNAGGMATSGYGTALGVFFKAKELKKRFEVFACETRPLLQGARITTWELRQQKIKTTLICDNMAATLMKQGRIQRIFVGADRVTMSGDFANKIGTYMLAVLAQYHRVPFYVVAPFSTFDPHLSSGSDIPIEERNPDEVTSLYFKKRIAPAGMAVFNPAFDVTDGRLVTAFVTEKGIVKSPYSSTIKKIMSDA